MRYDETISFLRKQESKEINREGATDILDSRLRGNDIQRNGDDIKGSRNNIGKSSNTSELQLLGGQ